MSQRDVRIRLAVDGSGQVKAELIGLGSTGEAAFRRIQGGTKDAEASAKVFEQALEDQKRQFDALRASVDPTFASMQRLEAAQSQLDAAVLSGIASQSEADDVLRRLSGTLDDVDGATGANSNSMRNLAFQLNQVGQQGAVTGDYLGALAIQVPDILAGFGSLPLILAGGALAVGASLLPALLRADDATDDLAESYDQLVSALGRADRAIALASRGGISDLEQLYGPVTARVAALADELERLEIRAARVEIDQFLGDFLSADLPRQIEQTLGGVAGAVLDGSDEGIADLRAEIAFLEQQIQNFPNASFDRQRQLTELREELAAAELRFDDAGSLRNDLAGIEGQLATLKQLASDIPDALSSGDFEGVANGISDLRSRIVASGVEIDDEIARRLANAEDVARRFAKALRDSGDDAGTLGDNLEDAAARAGLMSDNLSGALASIREMNSVAANSFRTSLAEIAALEATVGQPVERAGELAALDYREQTGAAAAAAAMRGDSAALQSLAEGEARARAQAEELARRRQALDEAERALNRPTSSTSAVSVDPDRNAARIKAAVRTEQERYNDELALANQLLADGKIDQQVHLLYTEQLAERLAEATRETERFGDVARSVEAAVIDGLLGQADAADRLRDALARAALEYALFGRGMFASEDSGFGGLLGPVTSGIGDALGSAVAGLFSADGGGYTGNGPRSGGLDGRGGFLAVLHPQETVVDHTRGQPMPGAGRSEVVVRLGEGLEADILQKARGQALHLVAAGVSESRRGLAGDLQRYDRRGTT